MNTNEAKFIGHEQTKGDNMCDCEKRVEALSVATRLLSDMTIKSIRALSDRVAALESAQSPKPPRDVLSD